MQGWRAARREVDTPAGVLPRTAQTSTLTYGALAFAVVAWGGSFVAARLVLATTVRGQATLSPTVLAALRLIAYQE
jgi:hypothetical protein